MPHHNSVLGCCSSVLRSSRLQMLFKISVLKNFTNCTGKHLSWSLFLIRPSGLKKTPSQASQVFSGGWRPVKTLQYRRFPVKFPKLLTASFSQNTTGSCFCAEYKLIFACWVGLYSGLFWLLSRSSHTGFSSNFSFNTKQVSAD